METLALRDIKGFAPVHTAANSSDRDLETCIFSLFSSRFSSYLGHPGRFSRGDESAKCALLPMETWKLGAGSLPRIHNLPWHTSEAEVFFFHSHSPELLDQPLPGRRLEVPAVRLPGPGALLRALLGSQSPRLRAVSRPPPSAVPIPGGGNSSLAA